MYAVVMMGRLLLRDTHHDVSVVVVYAQHDAVAFFGPGHRRVGTDAVIFGLAVLFVHHADEAHPFAVNDADRVADESNALSLHVTVLLSGFHRESHVEITTAGPCARKRQRIGGGGFQLDCLIEWSHDHLVHRHGLYGTVGLHLVIGQHPVERVGGCGPFGNGRCGKGQPSAVVGHHIVGPLDFA